MIGLGSIAPALKTAISAIRTSCGKDEIPGALAEIEPGPAFIEWTAEVHVKNAERIESVHRETA